MYTEPELDKILRGKYLGKGSPYSPRQTIRAAVEPISKNTDSVRIKTMFRINADIDTESVHGKTVIPDTWFLRDNPVQIPDKIRL